MSSLQASELWDILAIFGLLAILAGFARFVSSQIHNDLIRSLEPRLQELEALGSIDLGKMVSKKAVLRFIIDGLDRRWRGVLGIDTIREKIRNWETSSSYLFCSLITVAIVSTLAPIATNKEVSYQAFIPDVIIPQYGVDSTAELSCVGIHQAPYSTRGQAPAIPWTIANNRFLSAATSRGFPPKYIMKMVYDINSNNYDDYAYLIHGDLKVQPTVSHRRARYSIL
ncbi:hypothetical protein Hte_000365 [Hypoxylon texense]